MKKLLSLFILGIFLLIPLSALCAGWTVDPVVTKAKDWTWEENRSFYQKFYKIKIVLESDGTNPAAFLLSTYGDDTIDRIISGAALVDIKTAQGTTAPDTYTLVVADEDGAILVSITTTSTTTTERWNAGSKIVGDVSLDFGDPGDSGDDIVIYLIFAK